MSILLTFTLALAALGSPVDSDGDGLSDFAELHKYRTNPLSADSDGDGTPDGDWFERREYTYVVRSVVHVLRPVTPDELTDDFQDARVLDETEDHVELEVLHYPFSTAPEALGDGAGQPSTDDGDLARWLAPGPTSDWNADLQRELESALAEDGIDVEQLAPRELVERVSKWLLERAEYHDGFTTFCTAFDETGAPYVPAPLVPYLDSGAPTGEDFAREISARGMFARRTRGSCSSSAIYLSGCLRALGIPTRTVLFIPLFDAGDEREWALVQEGLRQPYVKRTVLSGMRDFRDGWTSHTFNEVWLAGRWWRLDYDELGVGILRRERFGLMTHVATFRDWADARMADTIGRRHVLRERDALLDGPNPYSMVSVRDAVGVHCTLELPSASPLTARVDALVWTDDPALPDDVRSGLEAQDRFGLLARVSAVENADDLREFLALADRNVVLEAEQHTDLHVRFDPNCWWFRGDHALVYLPFEGPARRDLEPAVEYTVRMRNDSIDARFEAAPDLSVVRSDPVVPPRTAASHSGVRGVVLDATGNPVRARVAAVDANGSVSVTTNEDGHFQLAPTSAEFVLHASTEDGRLAVLPGVRTGASVDLVLRPAARLTLSLEGRPKTRVAIFQGAVRLEDFTLRATAPVPVVVPDGELLIRLYEGETTHAERSLQVELDTHQDVRFKVD